VLRRLPFWRAPKVPEMATTNDIMSFYYSLVLRFTQRNYSIVKQLLKYLTPLASQSFKIQPQKRSIDNSQIP
jgi:hypothetical protein